MTIQSTVFRDRRYIAPIQSLLILCLMCALCVPSAAAQSVEKNSIKARQEVEKLAARSGLGEKASLRVKLRDKSEVKGYVSQLGTDGFTVVDKKTGQPKTIAYDDVINVKGNRSFGAQIGIGVGVGAGIVFGALGIYALQGGFGG
jgi:hypothetical protein